MLFASTSFHVILSPLASLSFAFIFACFSWFFSFTFTSVPFHVLSPCFHHFIPVVSFHFPSVNVSLPFILLLHCPCIFLSCSFILTYRFLTCWIYFRVTLVFVATPNLETFERKIEQQIWGILRRTEKRHRNLSIIVVSYTLDAACLQPVYWLGLIWCLHCKHILATMKISNVNLHAGLAPRIHYYVIPPYHVQYLY